MGLVFWLGAFAVCQAQDAVTENAEIVVSATRVPIEEETSPATVTVVAAEDFAEKQIKRVADALREVPGLAVTQSGAPGSLTSVFTRGLRSEHTQVLLDGIPINQGLQGAFNFADLTVDDIDRIEVVRGPQSTLYGPSALAGVIQIFTRRGSGPASGAVSVEGGSFDTFRASASAQGSYKQLDYSLGLSG
ncbi:MAG: TonB-dependent receptor plug domain-containing protein, partial [Verrucomicrobiota bacterium]|nr:TonB-dependent receptor plug domain-containing protein [Verrucomicrobiota bacterium]